MHDVRKLHELYGQIVRTAPDEVSFSNAAALPDIFVRRPGHTPFMKNQKFVSPPPGQSHSMVTTPSEDDHTRMRTVLNYAFTEKALKSQEPIIQTYVQLMVDRLRETVDAQERNKGEGATVNILDWYNFFFFDVVGDLGFGESFGCLRDGAYHTWVSMVFQYMKGLTLAAATKYWPFLEVVLFKLLPKRIVQAQHDHFQLAVDKINRRMNLEKDREDFISHVMKRNEDFKEMSLEEIQTTFAILIIAGSETTATVLSGMTNYLVQNPPKLQKLTSEIRSTFTKESAITIAAVKDMPYLNACLNEGLRMCNPVPSGLPRVVPPEGDTVMGQWLPEFVSVLPFLSFPSKQSQSNRPSSYQTQVSVNSWTLYHDPALFARAEEFVPERWLESPSRPKEFDGDQLSAVNPFSLGPRNCIGKALAWAEMRVIVARIVWAFDLEAKGAKEEWLDWTSLKTFLVVEKKPVEVRMKIRKV